MFNKRFKYFQAVAILSLAFSPVAVKAQTVEYQDTIQVNNIDTLSVQKGDTDKINVEQKQETTSKAKVANTSVINNSNDITSLTEQQRQEYIKALQVGSVFYLNNVTYTKQSDSLIVDGMVNNSVDSLVIPDSIGGYIITSIKERAFEGKSINSLQIGNNILSIGHYAFSKSSINQLTLGSKLVSVGDYAFERNSFSRLSMPNSLSTIGVGAFSNGVLSDLSISLGLRTIAPYAFNNNQLKVVQIPNTVTAIEEYSFADNQISSLTLRQGLLSIGNMAFSNNRITDIYVPNTVTVIGNYVYNGNPVSTVTMPERMKNYLNQITSSPTSLSSLYLYEEGKDPGTGTTAPQTSNNQINKVTDSTILGMSVKQGSFSVVQPKFSGNSFGTFELSKSELQKQIGFSSDVFVVDTTGTGKGWSLTVQASQFTEVAPSNGGTPPKGGWLKLPQGSLKLTGVGSPYKVNVDGSTKPVESGLKVVNAESIIDNSPVSLITADKLSSFGTFGLDLSKAKLILNLDPTTVLVDSENYPNSPTPYTTTITWTLTAGPGN